ncbi:LOW QUALITY PROTEIN: hypothetical protein QYF61_021610 [Mycteria americana]|uniref:Integrase n=1 Tax=Mycteria americana TaxID=33587 RepID=A0AAN7NRS0_MYCAM|nr:LOW QUALITY PROTEIN: hypothetical protein QYF61_021610 [Mycteria americana]
MSKQVCTRGVPREAAWPVLGVWEGRPSCPRLSHPSGKRAAEGTFWRASYSAIAAPSATDPVWAASSTQHGSTSSDNSQSCCPDTHVALVLNCDQRPRVRAQITIGTTVHPKVIWSELLLDTGADVTCFPLQDWPKSWPVQLSSGLEGVGRVAAAWQSVFPVTIVIDDPDQPGRTVTVYPHVVPHIPEALKGCTAAIRNTPFKFSLAATAYLVSSSKAIPLEWKNDDPIWVEQWLLTQEKLQAAHEIVAKELQAGHLEESFSPWNTPIFVIPKKDKGRYHLLHDLRQVNKQMVDMGALQPGLPLASAIPEGWPIVAIDIADCFFSIPLAEPDRKRFAFMIPSINLSEPATRYQWRVLPQGMKNSPTICQYIIAQLLAPQLRTKYSLWKAEEIVKKTLTQAGLKIQGSKVQKGTDIKYLGLRITPERIVPQAVTLPVDIKTLHDAQKLVGALQWLRTIIGIPPEWMAPLYELLKGQAPWEARQLTPEARASLEKITGLIAQGGIDRWDPNLPLKLFITLTKKGAVATIGQGTPEKPRILAWILSNQSHSAFTTYISMIAILITKGRRKTILHFGKEPAEVWLPIKQSQWQNILQGTDHIVLALENYNGDIKFGKTLEMHTHINALTPKWNIRVLTTPKEGPTIFTDASSQTHAAVAVWQEKGVWQCQRITAKEQSVQWLEARAVTIAMQIWPDRHTNIVTDSLFVFKLLSNMSIAGWAGSDIALIHTTLRGYYQIGNEKADTAAKSVWTLQQAKDLHQYLHLGAKALAKQCDIPLSQARDVVSCCPYCQHSPLWNAGVNPRGLQPNQIWQTDFTMCPQFRPQPCLVVTVNTCSGFIAATMHRKVTARAAQIHWNTVIAYLGTPQVIKTDNGSCFTAASTIQWAQRWDIKLIHGIPYNSQGQAIVERANQTLKTKIKVLGEGEGYTQGIPSHLQPLILTRALYALNHHIRGEETKTSAEKHWTKKLVEDGPNVLVRSPETGAWEPGWQLVTQGRGYAAVKQGDSIRWVPARWIKPDLKDPSS